MNKSSSITPHAARIIKYQETESPFTGAFCDLEDAGTYLCRRCGHALYRSSSKFHAGCGWPSFDDEIPGAVAHKPDADGRRVEIVCAACDAHLGHVFSGEEFTPKNNRHCVNSASLDFVSDEHVKVTEEAIFAAGCFWGVQQLFNKVKGVLFSEVGYIGGEEEQPTYKKICAGTTGHVEAIRIIYDPKKVSYEDLVKYFFEIHDPEQKNGQGPDLGSQYLSVIFYEDSQQKNTALALIEQLSKKGMNIATELKSVGPFYPAELYHQDYYTKNGGNAYCHIWTKRF